MMGPPGVICSLGRDLYYSRFVLDAPEWRVDAGGEPAHDLVLFDGR